MFFHCIKEFISQIFKLVLILINEKRSCFRFIRKQLLLQQYIYNDYFSIKTNRMVSNQL